MDNKNLEEAVRYISLELKYSPRINRIELIEKASRKFNLNPMETEFLYNKYTQIQQENEKTG